MDFWVISAIIIGAVLFIFFIYALLQPREWEITVEGTIPADRERTFAYLNTIRNWEAWTAWSQASKASYRYTYEGPDSGPGATQLWKVKRQVGRVKITGGEAPHRIEHVFVFGKGGNKMNGELKLEMEENGQTRIHWKVNGDTGDNPSLRITAKLMRPYIQRDLQAGLDRLRDTAESWSVAP